MTLCCSSAGGTLTLKLGGTIYSVRGSASVQPQKFEAEAVSNLDGTLAVTYKPVPVKAEFTISDNCGLSVKELTGQQCTEAVLELDAVGKTYILVNAAVIGLGSLDVTTGEISGLSLAAADAREILTGEANLNF